MFLFSSVSVTYNLVNPVSKYIPLVCMHVLPGRGCHVSRHLEVPLGYCQVRPAIVSLVISQILPSQFPSFPDMNIQECRVCALLERQLTPIKHEDYTYISKTEIWEQKREEKRHHMSVNVSASSNYSRHLLVSKTGLCTEPGPSRTFS